MEFDFLKNFTRRMKHVGAYALLFKNSINKQTWKQYGFDSIYEQTNLIFSVLLYIMEQSLKEESCTMNDIGYFVDGINMAYYKRPLSYDECVELGDFIVNVVLCDEGRAMYFQGYNYEQAAFQEIHISFVANKVLYIDGEVKRTSYYLTDEGYNLMLSTLELESNMKLTIHEMIFQLHLEKANYDKAVDEIKNIFNLLRIQLQRIQEAMRKIRQNALNYTVEEYSKILDENMSTIDETKKKFIEYQKYVTKLVNELERQDVHIEKLEKKDSNNLKNLKIIEGYLNRALDEHQKILSNHFDLKSLYTKELEALSQMSMIQRFQFRTEFYNKILEAPDKLENMECFLRPLFVNAPEKIYQLERAYAYQKPIVSRELEESEAMVDFDNEAWLREQNEKLLKKLAIYNASLKQLLLYAKKNGEILLSELKNQMTIEEKELLFPTVEIFREIMIELLKVRLFLMKELRKEKQEHFSEAKKEFQISQSLLELVEEIPELSDIVSLEVKKVENQPKVEFVSIWSETGQRKKIICSDVSISVTFGLAE